MKRIFKAIADNPKTILAATLIVAAVGLRTWQNLAVDVFPDISVPRVTIHTEAGGLTAEEVEQLVTIPIESVVNGIPGVSTIRSSSSGGLSFVWIDFDWNVDVARARFDVFERLARVKESLPDEAHAEISPIVSVTGEIMLVALTGKEGGASALEIREIAEYDLRTRLLGIPGIGEVAVIGGRLPEYRVAADPRRIAEAGLSLFDIMEAARDTRTFLSGGYLANVAGEEVPLRQIARADTLDALKLSPIPLANGGSLRLGDVADVSVAGEPRRGSASFNGKEAVVLSVQKASGGNTPALTKVLEKSLADFAETVKSKGIEVHSNAYRQADFIEASIKGGGEVVRDAVIIVIAVLLLTLLELRTILVVLLTMPLSTLLGLALFPMFGLGVNVMTLGGFAVAAGDIVDAAIIFTEVIRRKLGENEALPPEERRPVGPVIADAAASVAPGVLFSTVIVVMVFIPLLMLSGLEGRFFRPLALSYICVFTMSLLCAWVAIPALSRILRVGSRWGSKTVAGSSDAGVSLGVRIMRAVYRPFLSLALRFPKCVVLLSLIATGYAVHVATGFGSSFLPPFHEDSFNVMVSLPPGASLAETERVSESCVPAMASIPGVLSVTRRTGRAERDQHAEPVSSSEFVVRVDLSKDTDAIRSQIRERLDSIPGCALIVGYPIAHRISAVLSGTEAELAVNIYGNDVDVLRETVAKMKAALEAIPEVSDVRANREITVRTLRVDYDMPALVEAGITPREAGEQVAAAFNGAPVGEVRNGIRKRSVTVRLNGDENEYDINTVKSLVLSGRAGKRVRLDDVARVVPEEAPNLLLREGGLRKALISCNPAPGVNTGELVKKLRTMLTPVASEAGCTVSFGGSYQARESAGKRLGVLGVGLVVAIFFLLVLALGSGRAAALAMLNVPLGLVGSVVAVSLAEPVLSVSSLVGFVTVIGFVLRNGILLINCYRERLDAGDDLAVAIREGSLERMAPIIMTSLTTVIGLIPIMIAGNKPGGELLAPIAVVQFGGLLGASALNLIVLPAAAKVFGLGLEKRP
ncbi:MAG: efflux RND transporter permease subunit [Kiritimatiellae bacterium]|nr:efflux RND transporter permease subunit [Kiritimatiellia bacterium]